jgi:hypothetical protein
VVINVTNPDSDKIVMMVFLAYSGDFCIYASMVFFRSSKIIAIPEIDA